MCMMGSMLVSWIPRKAGMSVKNLFCCDSMIQFWFKFCLSVGYSIVVADFESFSIDGSDITFSCTS